MGKIIIPPENPELVLQPGYALQFSWTPNGEISSERFHRQAEAEAYGDEVVAASPEGGDYGVVRIKNAEDHDPATDGEALPERIIDPGHLTSAPSGRVVYLPISPIEE